MRYQFWHAFLGNAPTIPPVLYGSNETRPSQDADDEQEVTLYHHVSPGSGRWLCTDGASGDAEKGEYVMFTYEGLESAW